VNRLTISVVICFRDWGLDRLMAAIRSHFANARICGIDIEVIVSDYGSRNASEVASAVEALGARVVRTDTSGPWSRAASLNAGVRVAAGLCVVTTDADIVFTPATFAALLELYNARSDALYLVQCRDLPESFGVERIQSLLRDGWEDGIRQARQHATIRPRWGMGGFAAFAPALFAAINGYDERLKFWGGEDNDFAQRSRRAGFPVRWLSRSEVSVLHIWHEPSRPKAAQSEEGDAAMAFNREIVRSDRSVQRNLPLALTRRDHTPLVSVIIPTYRRSDLLWDSIASCLLQTFEDFEVLVVENGDSDEAEPVVCGFGDPRIRYLYCPRKGAAAARNFGLSHVVGRYIVIHDDDDVMVSTRLNDHLAALRPGQHGTYCGWIDFNEGAFEVVGKYPGKEFFFKSVLCTGKVLTHGGLMLDRRVFSMFRYEESLAAGIDYGFVLLLARNGLSLGHTGTFGLLRRLHRSNMTAVNASEQKAAAHRMAGIIKGEINGDLYKAYRAEGIAAKELVCHNESMALGELSDLKCDSSVERSAPVIRAEEFGGGSVEALVRHSNNLDDRILRQIKRRRPLPVHATGFSPTAMIFMKLRCIYWSNQAGRLGPTWAPCGSQG
jgi:GT2 family glycosyltransferase